MGLHSKQLFQIQQMRLLKVIGTEIFHASGLGLGSARQRMGHNSNDVLKSDLFVGRFKDEMEIQGGNGWDIRNNTIVSDANANPGAALTLKLYKNGTDPSDDMEVKLNNNIIVNNNSTSNDLSWLGPTAGHTIAGNKNIWFTIGHGANFKAAYYNNTRYNTWAAYKAAASAGGLDANSPDPADPKFVNTLQSDFRLRAASHAIGAGVVTGSASPDAYGNPYSATPRRAARPARVHRPARRGLRRPRAPRARDSCARTATGGSSSASGRASSWRRCSSSSPACPWPSSPRARSCWPSSRGEPGTA